MKTIPVDQLERLTKALEQQDEHEAIGLTKNAGTVAWVLRVPEALKNSEADVVVYGESPAGRIFVVVQAKDALRKQSGEASGPPVFGAGRGTLTVLSEDDDYLRDFQEYME